ncbi:MAG: hypothetical protein ABEI39_04950 [Halobacteriales archaeon]
MDDPGRSGGVRAVRSRIPPLARAAARYLSRHPDPGVFAVVRLKGEVESEIDALADRIFADVEAALEDAAEAGEVDLPGPARFDYDTRLLLPAMLTLGRLHVRAGDVPVRRRVGTVDEGLLDRGREVTLEIVRALLDGDMRDAINDEEYVDFETNARPRERAAAIAQERLRERVEAWFHRPETPDAVAEHYRHAVAVSERHQDQDAGFRELRGRLAAGEAGPDELRERYKHADVADPPAILAAESDLPYFATQYERVGVIYEGMLGMYEAALGIELDPGYKRSIVLMVIAAQIGLDDTDDYPADRGEQLTPVTAELLVNDPGPGVELLRGIATTYLDRAAGYADDHLAGMAIAYIREQARDRLDRLAATAG